MEKLKAVLRNLKMQALSFMPEVLPQTDAAMVDFAKGVLLLGNLPVNNSFMRAIATAIMHLGQDRIYITKRSMLNHLRRAIASQSAYNIIDIIKRDEDAKKAQVVQGTESNVVQEA